MADIAKLGIVVEAQGVGDAKTQLQQLSDTGQLTSAKLVQLANAGGTASAGVDKVGAAARSGHVSIRSVSGALGEMVGATGLLGSSSAIAARAFGALVGTLSPATILFAGLAGVVAFTVQKLQDAKENLRQLDEINLKNIQKEIEGLKFTQSLNEQARVILAIDPALQSLAEKYEKLRTQAEKLGDPMAVMNQQWKIQAMQNKEQSTLINGRTEAIAKQQQAIQNEIMAMQFEAAMIGKTNGALIALQTAQRISAILSNENAKALTFETSALALQAQKVGDLKAAEDALNIARGSVKTGKEAVSKFETSFGVQFDFSKQLAGQQLAENFVTVFNQFRDDRNAQTQLNQAFGSFVQQALAMGLPNIEDLLLSQGLSSANLMRLEASLRDLQIGAQEVSREIQTGGMNAFGGWEAGEVLIETKLVPIMGDTLVKAVQASATGVRTWGDAFQDASNKATASFRNIGAILENSMVQAEQAVDSLISQLLSIPNIERTVVIRTVFVESPPRPFSEFIPTMKSRFAELGDLVKNMTPTISFPVAPSGGNKSAGVGGGASVTIDLRGAAVHPEALHNMIIPALERALVKTTGQDPGFRVLN